MKRMLILATVLLLALTLAACSVPKGGEESPLNSGSADSGFVPGEGAAGSTTTGSATAPGCATGVPGADGTTMNPAVTTEANEVILPAGTSAATAGTTTVRPGSSASTTQSEAAPTQAPTTKKATTTSDDGKVHLPMIPAQ